MEPKTDAELVRRILEGDVASYTALVQRYERLVFGLAYQHLSNVEDASDVAQNTFIRAFTYLHQVRDGSRVKAWLRQIAVNECQIWRQKHRPANPLEEETLVFEAFAKVENRLLIAQAMESLDDKSRLTMMLFYGYAYSQEEIGDLLSEPVTTIKSRLRNTKEKLRRELGIKLERKNEQSGLEKDFAARVTQIIEAVREGDEATVLALIQKDPELLDAREEPGRHTPLHIAASSGDAAMVELLLGHGANPNALDTSDNAMPIHYAAERGWLDVVTMLVDAGSDVNWTQDLHERGPLGWATVFERIQVPVAEYLVSKGAKFDVFSASALGRQDVVKEIITADPTVPNQQMSQYEERQTPIEFATSVGQHEIADYIASLKTELTLSEAAGLGREAETRARLTEDKDLVNRSLRRAVKAKQAGTARILLEHGADPNYAPSGVSLIFDALERNDEEMCRLLMEFGGDLEFRDSYWNSTALGWQVFFGRITQTKLALALGAKIDDNLPSLALEGEEGKLRRFSSGTPEEYRRVREMLISAQSR